MYASSPFGQDHILLANIDWKKNARGWAKSIPLSRSGVVVDTYFQWLRSPFITL